MNATPAPAANRVRQLPGAGLPGLLLAVAMLAASAPAQSQTPGSIYRCEVDNGPPVYQNAPGRNCKPLDLPALTSVPAGPARAAAAPRPAGLPATGSPAAGSPAGFPRVGEIQQRDRDSDRRRILLQELDRERGKLAEVRREYNGGQPERLGDERNYQKYLDRVERLKRDLTRSESNVGSLQRELDALR